MWETLKNKVKVIGRGKWILLLVGALGVVLILFGSLGTKEEVAQEDTTLGACESYRLAMQEEAEALCKQVRGVGRVHVSVTLEKGEVVTYTGSKVTSVTPPTVRGVAVVCDGGGSDTVRQELTALLTALFHIGANHVHISPMK